MPHMMMQSRSQRGCILQTIKRAASRNFNLIFDVKPSPLIDFGMHGRPLEVYFAKRAFGLIQILTKRAFGLVQILTMAAALEGGGVYSGAPEKPSTLSSE